MYICAYNTSRAIIQQSMQRVAVNLPFMTLLLLILSQVLTKQLRVRTKVLSIQATIQVNKELGRSNI